MATWQSLRAGELSGGSTRGHGSFTRAGFRLARVGPTRGRNFKTVPDCTASSQFCSRSRQTGAFLKGFRNRPYFDAKQTILRASDRHPESNSDSSVARVGDTDRGQFAWNHWQRRPHRPRALRAHLLPRLSRQFRGAIWGQSCPRKADPTTIYSRCFLSPFPFAERTYSASPTHHRRSLNVPFRDLKSCVPLRDVRVRAPLRLFATNVLRQTARRG
jgi:hypothetical protein